MNDRILSSNEEVDESDCVLCEGKGEIDGADLQKVGSVGCPECIGKEATELRRECADKALEIERLQRALAEARDLIAHAIGGQHETPRSQEEDPGDTARLDFIEGDCVELRCKSSSNGDDADVYFEAVKFYMAIPKERVVGFGSTARDAIDKAMANEDDKCAYCEGSGCTLCKPRLQQETAARVPFVKGGPATEGCLCWRDGTGLVSQVPECPIHAQKAGGNQSCGE